MTIEIKSIEIDVDGVILKLTPEQASNLKYQLDKLLTSPTQQPYAPWPTYPFWYSNPTVTSNELTFTEFQDPTTWTVNSQ